MLEDLPYREIWAVDFEFNGGPGERPNPVCMVAKELRSGRMHRLWRNQLHELDGPPFDMGPNSLFVAYYASAEFGCFLALGWPMPERILDLFAEFRVETNGLANVQASLLHALFHYGLPAMGAEDKRGMVDLILGGGPWRNGDRRAILDYCQGDVEALERLLPALSPAITANRPRLGQALMRGRYMVAAARMEWAGVPIDAPYLGRLRSHWSGIRRGLIKEVDRDIGVFEGQTFKAGLFEDYLVRHEIPWPRLASGKLALDRNTFRAQARSHPDRIAPIHELRHALSDMRLEQISVGSDGRCRTMLSAFRAKTGRNQPSSTKGIFGLPAWIRGLIRPGPGQTLAYCDWASQEMAIAAALSGDQALMEAYLAGDVYLAFAKQLGLAPPDATKETHGAVRDRCKAFVLGVNYGMSSAGLANRAGISTLEARELLLRHRETYPRFWQWIDDNVNLALAGVPLRTRFGWQILLGNGASEPNARSLMNFPMQAHGAEMMRLAASMATEAGLRICVPVHDALLLETETASAERDIARLRNVMEEASETVMGVTGFRCRVDANVIRYPAHYADPRGAVMWDRVMALLENQERIAGHGRSA
ncbi:MAG: DNA polymerase [Alphaproteobacteria bacterium]|nr:DNA polymerase [Alphaproteobacteria bacterium]